MGDDLWLLLTQLRNPQVQFSRLCGVLFNPLPGGQVPNSSPAGGEAVGSVLLGLASFFFKVFRMLCLVFPP